MHPFLKTYFSIIKKFTPSRTENTSAGLDIGSGECKLIELKKTDSGFEIVHWAIEPINNGDVATTITQSLTHLSVPCPSLYTGVFGKGTLIRYIDMPRMPLNDLKNSFAIEADKYFPFASDQIYTDCFILDPQGKDKQMSVMAAAARKEIIDQRIKLLNDVGLSANFIGLAPIALSNVYHTLGPNQNIEEFPVVAMLDMGDSVSSLTILVDRIPRFTRDIFIGGKEFTKRISNALSVTPQEADALKKQPGARLPEMISACESLIANIIQELKLSFDYFTTEKGKEIKCLLITGGSSLLGDMDKIFEKQMEMKVYRWNPISNLNVSSKINQAELQKNSCKLGVALGLALYEYD